MAAAQHWDRHIDSDAARVLYRRSAYAHGYIHGYEDGFLQGDIELQMGRSPRPFSAFKSYREANSGYDRGFGSKDLFQLGYRQGFREAYTDASHDGRFRAVGEITATAEGLSLSRAVPNHDFDLGFAKGYDAGRQRGLESGQAIGDLQLIGESCYSSSRNRDYCDGYSRGFRLGNADGLSDRVGQETQTAQNTTRK